MQLTVVVFFIVLLWLAGLSLLLFKLSSHYNRLIASADKESLQSILEALLKEKDLTKKDIAMLQSRCDTIEKDGTFHIQKIGLKRFNPFKETGGDQSFILALVDGNDTGVVISGLYSRSGTRWYAKKVAKGKGLEHGLSEEEKKALQEAKRIT